MGSTLFPHDLNIEQLPTYEEVMNAHFHKASIMQISDLYDANIVDVGTQHLVVQITSWPRRVDALIR